MRPRQFLLATCTILTSALTLTSTPNPLRAADPAPPPEKSPAKKITAKLPADLQDQLRSLAKRVEADFATKNPDAKGLANRVDRLFQQKKPPPRTGFLQYASLPSDSVQVMSGVHSRVGLAFNNNPSALVAEIEEIESLLPGAGDPLPMLCRMTALTYDGERELGPQRTEAVKADALSRVRQLVAQAPDDAMAHAGLAECLSFHGGGKKECHVEATRALELDPNCWRAMLVMAELEGSRVIHELHPDGAPPLGEELAKNADLLRAIYDKVPDDVRIAAAEKRLATAQAWYDRVCAAAPQNPEPQLRRMGYNAGPKLSRDVVKLLRANRPSTFEAFQQAAQRMQSEINLGGNPFAGVLDLPPLQPDNPHLLATATLIHLMPAIAEIANSGGTRTFSPQHRALLDAAFAKLEAMGESADKSIAARACEGHAVLQVFSLLQVDAAAPRLPEMCLRSLALDYRRHSAWELLLATVVEGELLPEANAVTEIRVACWPYPSWHHKSATSASRMLDWESCERHLNAMLASKPDSITALIDLATVHLFKAAAKNKFEDVEKEFETLRDLYSSHRGRFTPDEIKSFATNLIVLFCLQNQFAAAEQLIRSCAEDGRISPEAADGLRAEMKK